MGRSELTSFLEELADSYSAQPEIWENTSVPEFLRAWAAWLGDMDGYFSNRGEPSPTTPSWQLIAEMLLVARVYE